MCELIWLILSKQTPYLYQKHRLTQEKQACLRYLAKLSGIMATSASPTKRSNDTALKGLKLPVAGRDLKTQASRIAAIRASNIYQAVTEGRLNNNIASLNKNNPKVSPGNIALADLCNTRLSGFNPFRPTQHDYEALLRDVLKDLISPHIEDQAA